MSAAAQITEAARGIPPYTFAQVVNVCTGGGIDWRGCGKRRVIEELADGGYREPIGDETLARLLKVLGYIRGKMAEGWDAPEALREWRREQWITRRQQR